MYIHIEYLHINTCILDLYYVYIHTLSSFSSAETAWRSRSASSFAASASKDSSE